MASSFDSLFNPQPPKPPSFLEIWAKLAPLPAASTVPTIYTPPRRTVFISHSHLHESESKAFLREFGSVFIERHIGLSNKNDRIKSNDPAYVMSRIRQELIQSKSTVTILLVGSCTHSRRYVDWEIKASLQQGEGRAPNGLLAIQLPSSPNGALLPPRMELNWRRNDAEGYARYYQYPRSQTELRRWIEEAFEARRTITDRIKNPHETMFDRNRECRICGITH
jgi:hypothetical protein